MRMPECSGRMRHFSHGRHLVAAVAVFCMKSLVSFLLAFHRRVNYQITAFRVTAWQGHGTASGSLIRSRLEVACVGLSDKIFRHDPVPLFRPLRVSPQLCKLGPSADRVLPARWMEIIIQSGPALRTLFRLPVTLALSPAPPSPPPPSAFPLPDEFSPPRAANSLTTGDQGTDDT